MQELHLGSGQCVDERKAYHETSNNLGDWYKF